MTRWQNEEWYRLETIFAFEFSVLERAIRLNLTQDEYARSRSQIRRHLLEHLEAKPDAVAISVPAFVKQL